MDGPGHPSATAPQQGPGHKLSSETTGPATVLPAAIVEFISSEKVGISEAVCALGRKEDTDKRMQLPKKKKKRKFGVMGGHSFLTFNVCYGLVV